MWGRRSLAGCGGHPCSVRWFLNNPGGGPCGCLSLPLLGSAAVYGVGSAAAPAGLLWMLFSAFLGCAVVLAVVGAVVCPGWWRALWVLPLAVLGLDPSLVARGSRSCGCGFRFFLVGGRWWRWWVVLLPVLVGSLLGGAPRRGCLGLAVYCGGVGGFLSLLAVVPVAAARFFACPPFTVGVGCVALFPGRRSLLCPRPRGLVVCSFLGGVPVSACLGWSFGWHGAGPVPVVVCLCWLAPVDRLGGVVSRFPSGGPCGCCPRSRLAGGSEALVGCLFTFVGSWRSLLLSPGSPGSWVCPSGLGRALPMACSGSCLLVRWWGLPLPFFLRCASGALPPPPSALLLLVHALVSERRDQLEC